MPVKGVRLIVHADDFGLTEKVNEGILEAHCQGILTSASIMPVGEAFGHAIGLARLAPTLDLGVHLTLIEEKPLSSPEAVSTLVDDKGRFYPHASDFVKAYLRGKISPAHVVRELEAQIQTVLDERINVSHLDSHQHIHMLPGIRRVVERLASKYNIPAIRYPRERFKPYMLKERKALPRLTQLLTLNAFCTLSRKSQHLRPDHFFGFFFGGKVTEENLLTLLKKLPAGETSELMCHPGRFDAACRYDHWQYRRQDELRALTGQKTLDFLAQRGILLISYADLAR